MLHDNEMRALPTTTTSLCGAFTVLCPSTWYEIKAGVDCGQPLDEESITTYNLMRLATAVPTVVLKKHSRRREGRTGADWEIWSGRPGSWIGFRVQAKIINPGKLEYAALYHFKAHATKQLDKLIKGSKEGSHSTYPIYCFYNYWDLSIHKRTPPGCPYEENEPELAGWSVLSAFVLRDTLKARLTKKLQHYEPHMYPIGCLFCCRRPCQQSFHQPSNTPRVIAERILRWWGERADTDSPRVHSTLPPYVARMYSMVMNRHLEVRSTDARREHGAAIPGDLSRVVLIAEPGGEG